MTRARWREATQTIRRTRCCARPFTTAVVAAAGRTRAAASLFSLAIACSCGHATSDAPTTPNVALISQGHSAPFPEVSLVEAPQLRHQTRPLPHDVASFRMVRDARISPDGHLVAYVVRAPTFDPEAEPDEDLTGGWKVGQQLFVVDSRGGEPIQMTFGDEQVSSPRWSPDGSELAFMRKVGKKQALHVLRLAGGEAQVIDLGDLEPGAYAWSPDGQFFAVTAEQPPSDEEKLARFRRGGAWEYERQWKQVHLFVVPREGGGPRHVNRGTDTVVSFTWSPDGQHFALATAPSSDPYEAHLFQRVVVVSASDGALEHELLTDPVVVGNLEWSPDGRYVAYERSRETLTLNNELAVHEFESGRTWNAASGLDPTLDGFLWSADSSSIVAHVIERTRSKLYRLDRDGSKATALSFDGPVLSGIQADSSAQILATVASTTATPPDPAVLDLRTSKVRAVATVNPEVEGWTLGTSEVVRWRNADGVELEGILTVTPHAVDGEPPPLMVMPHGGPDWISLERFNTWAHQFAARGYSVFQPNYRGGVGYGYDFYAANRGRLGEIEFADIESGVDHLIASGEADPERLVYGGWSWGGYLTAWTLTKTNRYRAVVVGAGVIDVVTQYVTSDVNHGVVGEWEYRGRPWQQPENFARSNPSASLQNARTPTLILHGEEDPRVGFVNGQILYRALSDVGCPVRFFAYPGEPHSFQQPAHVEHSILEWAAWYDRHLHPPGEQDSR